MKVGTKSILFGGHQFIIHPIMVFIAWWRLYGFPWDLRLWVAFVVHDLGYWGKACMDCPDGEDHVEVGANLIGKLFGDEWHDFCLYHSRFYAKKNNKPFSRLCVADKYAYVVDPWWLYLFRVRLSGEVYEYLRETNIKYVDEGISFHQSLRQWNRDIRSYLDKWVMEHKDLREDTWTKIRETK